MHQHFAFVSIFTVFVACTEITTSDFDSRPDVSTTYTVTIPDTVVIPIGTIDATSNTPNATKGLWISEGLPIKATQDACKILSEFRLSCDIASSFETSFIQIYAEDVDCTLSDENFVWLGSGSGGLNGGYVSIRISCFLGYVGIDPDVTRYYTQVVAHEIGHAIGLQHVIPDNALMNKTSNPFNNSITEADREEFNKVWGKSFPR